MLTKIKMLLVVLFFSGFMSDAFGQIRQRINTDTVSTNIKYDNETNNMLFITQDGNDKLFISQVMEELCGDGSCPGLEYENVNDGDIEEELENNNTSWSVVFVLVHQGDSIKINFTEKTSQAYLKALQNQAAANSSENSFEILKDENDRMVQATVEAIRDNQDLVKLLRIR